MTGEADLSTVAWFCQVEVLHWHGPRAGDGSPLAAMFPPPPRIPCTASGSAATPSTEPPARTTAMAPPQRHHRSSALSQALPTTTEVEENMPHTAKATDASAAGK
eukprot:50656-Eustigmatos_ZCMA.PRE.1